MDPLLPFLYIFIALLLLGSALLAWFLFRKLREKPANGQVLDSLVLDALEDGLLVLDGSDTIIRMSAAAERIVGLPAQETNGKHIDQIFQNWHTINLQQSTDERMGFRASVFINNDWKILDVHIILMDSQDPSNGNKILIVRDITNIQTDERHFARENMLVFLRALSNAFKDAQTIQEFLGQALYQTLYTFNLEDGFIYLFEETNQPGEMALSLAAKHGTMDVNGILAGMHPGNLVVISTIEREPFLIKNCQADERVSACFKATPAGASLAFFPLVVESEIFGVLTLGRMQVNAFSPYEVMRFGAAADEIASFILKEREKQQQIAYMERQRLVIDLHDSITQKLYGLLTITEAVQVGLEAGAVEKTIGLMSMVSENARQAVREMRLFLHQLDPLDIERIGFVAAIQQRLMAVEGRASIKAHFKPAGKFSFSKEKERALYYITEEALNNVLKHAQAKSVEVKLRRRDGLITLDIIDDGICFDPDQADSGGRGLRSMRERAAKIGASFQITSEKNKGTKISLSFPE